MLTHKYKERKREDCREIGIDLYSHSTITTKEYGSVNNKRKKDKEKKKSYEKRNLQYESKVKGIDFFPFNLMHFMQMTFPLLSISFTYFIDRDEKHFKKREREIKFSCHLLISLKFT